MNDFIGLFIELVLAACCAAALMMLVSCSHLTAEQMHFKRTWRAMCFYPMTGNAQQDGYYRNRCRDSYLFDCAGESRSQLRCSDSFEIGEANE